MDAGEPATPCRDRQNPYQSLSVTVTIALYGRESSPLNRLARATLALICYLRKIFRNALFRTSLTVKTNLDECETQSLKKSRRLGGTGQVPEGEWICGRQLQTHSHLESAWNSDRTAQICCCGRAKTKYVSPAHSFECGRHGSAIGNLLREYSVVRV